MQNDDHIQDYERLSFIDVLDINENSIVFDTQEEYIRLVHKFTSMYICIVNRNDKNNRNDSKEVNIQQKLQTIIKTLYEKYEKRYHVEIVFKNKL